MLLAAVLGSPISHSLSPVLHEAGYVAAGLTEWHYERHEVTATGLAGFVAGLGPHWRGLSLTMPLKDVAFDIATTVSPIAGQARAINTLVRRDDGAWDATNTDVAGLVEALRHVDHGGRGRILGSGATARSAVLALHALGVTQVDVAARNAVTASDIVGLAAELGLATRVMALDDWARDPVRLVISTLPPAGSVAAGGALGEAGATFLGMTLLDVVYADWPTPLARAVVAAGGAVISGLDMLVHQAAAQFTLFTGVPAPVPAMMAAGRAAAAGR